MTKPINLLISFTFITGISIFFWVALICMGTFSCANQKNVRSKGITNQQFVTTNNQNDVGSATIAEGGQSSTETSTQNMHAVFNENSDDKDVKLQKKLTTSESENTKESLNPIGLAHFNLGIVYVEKGMIDEAILEFRNAIEQNPHHLESHIRLGTTYALKGMTREAMSEFENAMDSNLKEAIANIIFNVLFADKHSIAKIDEVGAHINLGNAYKEGKKLERAKLEYEKALELAPDNLIAKKSLSEIYYKLGISYLQDEKYDIAIAELSKALEINPELPQLKSALGIAHYNLGMNYAKKNELDKAISEFNKTVEVNPDYAKSDMNILEIISKNKKVPKVNDSVSNDLRREGSIEEEREKEDTTIVQTKYVQKTDKEVLIEKTSLSLGQIEHPYNLFPEYRIVPGDVLDVLFQIRTWLKKEIFKIAVDQTVKVKFVHTPDLNEIQIIRPDGKISLPYLGEVYVVGKTIDELTNELQDRYSQILQNPEIYVVVPEFRSGIKELKKDLHTAPRGLSRLVTVRPDGYVTFPMVGDVFVANKTIQEVSKKLNDMYDQFLPGLHCDLFLEEHSGSVIYVVGEVNLPGTYKIAKPVSVVEAIALAGSYTSGAKLSSIIVARKNEHKVVAVRINLKEVLALKKSSKFFYLQPDDIVYVPKTYIRKAADVARDIADIFFFRGWGIGLGFSYELHNEPSKTSSTRVTSP